MLALFATFMVIQLIPYGRSHTNPNVISEVKWDAPQTKELFDRACMDCHSNQTQWPWYSNIAPLSWVIQHHVDDGRKHFNISVWGTQKKNEGDEAAEELQEGEMPLAGYVFLHPKARLTKEEKQQLLLGLQKTFPSKKHD